jgi:hypothetical protein
MYFPLYGACTEYKLPLLYKSTDLLPLPTTHKLSNPSKVRQLITHSTIMAIFCIFLRRLAFAFLYTFHAVYLLTEKIKREKIYLIYGVIFGRDRIPKSYERKGFILYEEVLLS